MRKKIVAGNWKMNKSLSEGIELAKEINNALKVTKVACQVVLGTPFIHLADVCRLVDENIISISAQNCADKESGAFTGEVSAGMIKSTGATHVILGHSERRQYYGETNPILKEKVSIALKNELTPIFCIGETLSERESGKYFEVIKTQLEEALFDFSAEDFTKIVLAYEPVWAIGTGKTATAEQAQEIHQFIRQTIAQKYNNEAAQKTSILYGGSCNASNAATLFAQADIDGGLIGGASLKPDDFLTIIQSFKKQ
jgi:triosephosphate isomerase